MWTYVVGCYAFEAEGSAYCQTALLVQPGVADVQTLCQGKTQEQGGCTNNKMID